MRNKEVAEKFYELAEVAELAGENPFKVKAYLEAARVIENLTIPIEELAKENKLDEIKGVGKSIAEKIKEYLETGKITKLEELKKLVPVGLLELEKVPGLGAKRVKVLYEKLGVKNLEDLERAAKEHKIRNLEGFGEKTEQKILEGIKSLRDKRTDRFLIGIALPIAESIINLLKENTPVDKHMICGSLRRMKDTIGDIDILVTSKNPSVVMDYFVKIPFVKEILAKGDTKSSIITQEGIQVDLRVVENESFGAAVQYFTGSKNHNVRLREIAIKKNLKLNEYGVFRLDDNVKIAGVEETDVYEALGLDWIPPEMREDTGEVELAMQHKLPAIVDYKDIKGDLHMHTKYSDGANTIEEMARKAISLGYEYIVITEHAKALGVAGGLSIDDFKKEKEEIEKLNKKLHPFKIFLGVELNILSDGSIDFDEKDLDIFDLCLAGIHTGMNQSEFAITERIKKVLRIPKVRIIVHPTGRIINGRSEYSVNIDEIFNEAKKYNKIFEINASFERLDLNDVNARKAVYEYGLKIAIGTDAHSTESMNNMRFGVGVARRAWLRKSDIINTKSLKEFEEFIKEE
ncbi:MAG: DNA polymerase/3'-5' exonuclease PolX [Caldisericum sp.]|uniref:DNA polymerase/3'-5' exonuclease PolX n=1 Tax=Caldisericum sp. TaxID=2499687 RepID=UPI003D11EE7D